MAKAVVNEINVHYQTRGTGPDVVLIHGITSSLALWYTQVIPALTPHYRVTAYDLRGHGLTQVTETGYTSRAQAQDLLALMDHLDIRRARIVGHSFGGAIGLHAALLAPERVAGVVLLDTGVACLRRLRVIKNWKGWEQYGKQLEEYGLTYESFTELDRQQDITPVLKKSFEVPIQFGIRKGASRATPRLKRLLEQTRVGSQFREVAGLTEDALQTILTPVLALYGTSSPYHAMGAHLREIMPRCSCEPLEDSGHFSIMEDPTEVLDRMAGFLQDPLSMNVPPPQGRAACEENT